MSTGASKNGTFKALFKNMSAFIKLSKGYLTDANPLKKSKPGQLNKESDVAYYECIKNNSPVHA